jgi:hypothetical protein
VIESSPARGLSLQNRERIPFIISHLPFAGLILALLRAISWIVRWAEGRRAIHEITRTDKKHNDKWKMIGSLKDQHRLP